MLTNTPASGSALETAGGSHRRPEPLRRALLTDGYAIVRDVLTQEQVQRLRCLAKKHLSTKGWYIYGGKMQVQAMHAVPGIAEIVIAEPILRIMKQAASPLHVLLTGECDVMMNTTSNWHKDTDHLHSFLGEEVFTDEDFHVYKIALYLQDQDETSPGTLKVRPGSHKEANGSHLPVRNTAVRAGDAIVFDIRIDHLGQLPTRTERILRRVFDELPQRLQIDPQKAFTKSRSMLRLLHVGQKDRMAIFMTFGSSEEWTRVYAGAARRHSGSDYGDVATDLLARMSRNDVSLVRH
ncbi:phytanoyl-CoA dioxygenase family protein [Aureimonas leprariae]|uniref:Phytanoyl-CoA dioxygenase family protein n=1 Tax=Plantimonas leprariae TaxID=2615207 RepID=A0A7V7TWT4_9HYPH|nr:phytanoyl-CoA dioxygenase family protein [Aureimonas leprariae]KAB0680353.1 phytanoyl-CoA dioxygenase family protein [Aureimonas leprariae]